MEKRPNILLIVTEQHRGNCLGCEGHPVLQTPNMDEIFASGARFSRFYSDCPICMPARRTILSGQYPATHGLVSNAGGVEWEPEATLPQVLRDQGYQTRWIGRSMHQFPKRARFGYEEVENAGSSPDSEYGEWLKANAPNDCGGWFGAGVMHNDWTARPWPLPEYLHQTNWTVQRALDFLRRRDPTCPFFLTLSFIAAHPPLQPPEVYFNRYIRTGVPDPVIGDWAEPPESPTGVAGKHVNLSGEALLNARAGYYGLINHLDDQLRRILNPIIGLRQGQDTVVCLTSDHGEMLGDHYRWAKSLPYEGSARVPFLISAPQQFGLGIRNVIDQPATLADVMPTLLDMAGAEIPESVDGQSLLPLFQNGSGLDREYVHIEHKNGMHALTDGRCKYIWNAQDGAEQMFDLKSDPDELHNIAETETIRVQLPLWRQRLIERLEGRHEGFTDGKKLIPGRPRQSALPHAGKRTPFERKRFVS